MLQAMLTVPSASAAGWAAYRAAVLADIPDLFVRLDTTAPVDLSPNGRTLTRLGTTSTTTDMTFGDVVDNTATADASRASWTTSAYYNGGGFTFEAVALSTADNSGLMAAWGGTGPILYRPLTPSGHIRAYYGGSARVTVPITSDWHHLAMTFDGTTGALFVDGASVGTWTSGSSGSQPVLIGRYDNSLDHTWRGLLHSVGYYKSALTPARIAAHAAAIGLSS